MGWSYGKNGTLKSGKESRCPENGGQQEARKTKIAIGDCIKSNIERVGEEWKNDR